MDEDLLIELRDSEQDEWPQKEARDILLQVKQILSSKNRKEPIKFGICRRLGYPLFELYKGLIAKDYSDALGTVQYLLRYNYLESTIMRDIIYKALSDGLGE